MRKILIVLLFVLPVVYGACISGDTKCDGESFLVCTNGNWKESAECVVSCDARSGCLTDKTTISPLKSPVIVKSNYKVCREGETHCDGQNLQACKNDSWQTQMTCGGVQVCTLSGCANKPIIQNVPIKWAVRNCMVCPKLQMPELNLPPQPFDESSGDCALLGKSSEINAYVRYLEHLADQCNIRSPEVMQHVLAVKSNINRQISQLPVGTEKAPDFSCFVNNPPVSEASCPDELVESSEKRAYPEKQGWTYTVWLESLRDSTLDYCRSVYGSEKPLIGECGKIKRLTETCRGTRPGTIVEYQSGMEAAYKKVHDNTVIADSLYGKTLKDFADFKLKYKEDLLDYCTQKAEAAPALVHEVTIVEKIVNFFKRILGLTN